MYFLGDLDSSNYIALRPKHEIVPIQVIAGTSRTIYNQQKVNPSTLLWSIKKEKWLKGPELPNDLLKFASHEDNLMGGIQFHDVDFQHMCATSVGSNSAFIFDTRKTFSFNFKKKLKVNLATISLFEKKTKKL